MIKVEMNNIVVREFSTDDFTAFQNQLCNNKGWNQAFQLWNVKGEKAVEFFAYHLRGYETMDIKENRLMYGVFTKSGLLIGECGFEYNPNFNAVEIFVGIIEESRGKGFSKEIVDALVEISKEIGLNKVNANIPEAHVIGVHMLNASKLKLENEYVADFEGQELKMLHYSYKN